MRLIDADALVESIKEELWHWDTVDGINAITVLKQTISDINNMPTIAQPEIIRCKDCRYWGAYPSSSATPWLHECHARIARLHTAADEYCSRAERREVSE